MEALSLIQVTGLLFFSALALWFLIYYIPIHDRRSPFARFIAGLNVVVFLLGLTFALDLVMAEMLIIEIAKAVVPIGFGLVMFRQLFLLSAAQRSGHEDAPTPPPEGQDRG